MKPVWVVQLEKILRGLMAGFQYMKGPTERPQRDILHGYVVMGNGFKLKEGTTRLGTREKFSTVRVVRCQNRFPREAEEVKPLEVVKINQAELSFKQSIKWNMALMAQGLILDNV